MSIREIVTIEPGIIRVNGEAVLATSVTGAAYGHVIEAIEDILDSSGCSIEEAGRIFVEQMRGRTSIGDWKSKAFVFEILTNNERADEMLAPNNPIAGSMLATRNGTCEKSGWPIVAGIHHIKNAIVDERSRRTGWVRTDKI